MAKMVKPGDEQRNAFDDVRRRLEHAIHVTDRHRLLFLLLTTSPKRPGHGDLLVSEHRGVLNSICHCINRRGELRRDLDAVLKYRSEIDAYAKLIDEILSPEPIPSPEPILRPAAKGKKQSIATSWSTAELAPRKPWLSPVRGSYLLLTESAASLREAAEQLMEIDVAAHIQKVAHRLSDRAFPGSRRTRPRVSWSYIETLDSLIKKLERELARLFGVPPTQDRNENTIVSPGPSRTGGDGPATCGGQVKKKLEPPAKAGKKTTDSTAQPRPEAPEGEWVGPITKIEMARRYTNDPNARWRKIESRFREDYIDPVTSRTFRFRIDHLDRPTRARCRG